MAPTTPAADIAPKNIPAEEGSVSAAPARKTSPTAAAAFSPVSSPAQPLPAEPVPTVQKEAALAPVIAAPAEQPAEIAASARMYAAHASLRAPEVADPDSKTNQQILQTMVSKALAQPAPTTATTR